MAEDFLCEDAIPNRSGQLFSDTHHLTRLKLVFELHNGIHTVQWYLRPREDQVGHHVMVVEKGDLAVEEDQGTSHHVRAHFKLFPNL